MPHFRIETNVPRSKIPQDFVLKAVPVLAKALGKPEQYCVVSIIPDVPMSFGGTTDPCAIANLMSIGALGVEQNKKHAKILFELVEQELGVKSDRSESESDYQSPRPTAAVVEVTKKQPKKKAAVKRQAPESTAHTSDSKSSKKRSSSSDLFGLEDDRKTSTSSGDFGSALISRVANGKVRRAAALQGDFYVEVKVYSKDEVASIPKEERWKKAQVALKVQLDRNTPQWDGLQIFMRRTHELFNNSEPVFYSDSVNIK